MSSTIVVSNGIERSDNFSFAFLNIYFGKLPDYFDFWAKTCEPNFNNFHWFVYNDHVDKKKSVNNAVTLVPYNFNMLCQDFSRTLGISIHPKNTRIVCDCRVIFYPIRSKHENLDDFDFIGYSDIDMLYGQLDKFLPKNVKQYSMISAHDGRPCGPFTLFNRQYLLDICRNIKFKQAIEMNGKHGFFESQDYTDEKSIYKPMLAIDESQMLVDISKMFAPVFCKADPLQPTRMRGLNHRKAVAFWNNGRLFVMDWLGRKKEGAFFHFSRYKSRTRFAIDYQKVNSNNFGVYKYGFTDTKSKLNKLKMLLSLFY